MIAENEYLILLVEDDQRVRAGYISLLWMIFDFRKIEAYRIDETDDESRAIDLIALNKYHLIVLDGRLLPGQHGENVIKAVDPKNHPQILVLSNDVEFVSECKELGLSWNFKKSFPYEQGDKPIIFQELKDKLKL